MNPPLDIFTIDCIVINSPARNRDEAFAVAGDLFQSRLGVSSSSIVRCLNIRENLSSTALVSEVAIPHGIVAGIQIPVGCLIKLVSAIDFTAPDRHKISTLIFLLFPEITTHEHLQGLSSLAEQLLDVSLRRALLSEKSPERISQLLNHAMNFRETLPTLESHSVFNQSIASRNQDIQNYLEEWAALECRPTQSMH
jgi:PTS system nitrogen regulatory IIA component